MGNLQVRRKPSFGIRNDPIYHELELAIAEPTSLLDLGCGSDSPVQFMRRRPKYMVGVDGFRPSILASKAKRIHDDYQCLDLRDLDQAFGENSFDCVLAIDVIEHFGKQEAIRLLQMAERIAMRRVVVLTPNGFLPQGEHGGNAYQKHLSGWTMEEMASLGYLVTGVNGWRPLLGEFAQPRMKPAPLWRFLSRLSQPLVRNNPARAFHLLCVKEVQGRSLA